MSVTRISASTTQSLPRVPSEAPRLFHNMVGGIIELVIHAVEDWRDRRGAPR